MSSNFVLLSDLHLGYEKSLLSDAKKDEILASHIADICAGETERLVLNGDALEACVPDDAGEERLFGLSPLTVSRAKSFFETLTSKIKIGKIILVWGNHDFSTWSKLAASCYTLTFTCGPNRYFSLKEKGNVTSGAEDFVKGVFGQSKIDTIRSAYPIYFIGNKWPYLVFHHGHFLDDLIIGQKSDAEYLGLKIATGAGRPNINVNEESSLMHLHHQTDDFLASVWESSSRLRELEWAFLRRLGEHPRCPFYPTLGEKVARVPETEPLSDKLGHRMTWFTNLLTADPSTPSPIGDPSHPSYLFIGHDHRGGFMHVDGLDGYNWKVVNSGGWTDDTEKGRNVHCHVVSWEAGAISPKVHCVKI